MSDAAKKQGHDAEADELEDAITLMEQVREPPEAWRVRRAELESRLARLYLEIGGSDYQRRSEAYRTSSIGLWQELRDDDLTNQAWIKELVRGHYEMCELLNAQGRYFEPYRRQGTEMLKFLEEDDSRRDWIKLFGALDALAQN